MKKKSLLFTIVLQLFPLCVTPQNNVRILVWQLNQDSKSVNYGPLTFSLKIKENYEKVSSIETAIGISKWQKDADWEKCPSYETYPGSDWNYVLKIDESLSGLTGELPIKGDMKFEDQPEDITLIPMGRGKTKNFSIPVILEKDRII